MPLELAPHKNGYPTSPLVVGAWPRQTLVLTNVLFVQIRYHMDAEL